MTPAPPQTPPRQALGSWIHFVTICVRGQCGICHFYCQNMDISLWKLSLNSCFNTYLGRLASCFFVSRIFILYGPRSRGSWALNQLFLIFLGWLRINLLFHDFSLRLRCVSLGAVINTDTTQSVEPLLNAHVYARIRDTGILKLSEWNSLRLTTTIQLWKVDSYSEQARDLIGENSVLETSRNIAQGRSFGNDVAPEVKAIYPVLSTCRSFLERLVTTVSPVHVSSLVVSQQFSLLMLNIGCCCLPYTC
jgi:hypothetical protein